MDKIERLHFNTHGYDQTQSSYMKKFVQKIKGQIYSAQQSPSRLTKKVWMVSSFLIFWSFYFTQPHSVNAQDKIPLRLGFMPETFSEISIADTKVAIEVYMAQVFHNTQYAPKAIMFQNVNDLKLALNKHTIEMVTLTTLDFVQSAFDSILTPSIISIKPDSTVLNTYTLLCHKNKNWSDLSNLQGAHIKFSQSDKLVPIWLDVLLAQSGHSKSELFLGKKTMTETPAQAALAVFFGQADACIIDTRVFHAMSELNPQIATALVPLAKSPGFLFQLFAFHKKTPQFVVDEIENKGFELTSQPGGQKMLQIFKAHKIIKYQPHHIQSVKDLLNDYHQHYGNPD